ncbi:hypothetical protein F7D01_13790 [Erythrobacter sp. 3-20A1M]|uniref:ADP-ribosylglycohydrolase family protein n=1 Tax=Erythrobacter sp. 3-20A1M TaxID=2653850 RepID=UPI001BFC2D67|nr:ADP-ribosylglycohydrolase family protein [Erythrobacter sp. 3-20A1M]QWC57994.1 hypothetical protein F7D01_13790 [Erythrobacter sp. 3-20A1M]
MTDRLALDDSSMACRPSRDRAEGAFLGAAIGDAMGWPHELRATRASGNRKSSDFGFQAWTKRSGGRFQPHEEAIGAGNYSDDTQLILACARSLLRDPTAWWLLFATQELPLWTLYQRGGGGATKRAATIWLSGRAPWDAKLDEVNRYLAAGGNGVAMRILPHCLRRAGDASFSSLAADIMTDGVTTHGHPRALVGALAYGYGLWEALRQRGTLGYGQLIEVVSSSREAWGALPSVMERWPSWAKVTDHSGAYHAQWRDVVQEQLELLEQCSDGLAGGVAVIDEDVLKDLGCFDKRVNGSGTVNAAAALFLASRHAADPMEGVKQAALAEGADTDTLASMTGGMLGAAIGLEWLSPFLHELQDRETIRRTANEIYDLPEVAVPHAEHRPVTKAALAAFLSELAKLREPSPIRLPNGLTAQAESWGGIVPKSSSLTANAWQLTLDDGQTIFVKKLGKRTKQPPKRPHTAPELGFISPAEMPPPLHLGLRLVVSNLVRSVAFYQDVLGLRVSKRSTKSVNLGGILSIVEGSYLDAVSNHVTVFAEVADVRQSLSAYERFMSGGAARIDERDDRTRLQCLDPDGYRVEVYQMNSRGAGG